MAQDTSKPKVLHLGCGQSYDVPADFKDFEQIRLDIDEQAKPDILADMNDLSAIPDNSYQGLFCSHTLEHLHAHQVIPVLRSFARILSDGGLFLTTMPDLQSIAEKIIRGELEDPPLYTSVSGPIQALDVLYGFTPSIRDGNLSMCHKTGYTIDTLTKKLQTAGFNKLDMVRVRYELWARAYITKDKTPIITKKHLAHRNFHTAVLQKGFDTAVAESVPLGD